MTIEIGSLSERVRVLIPRVEPTLSTECIQRLRRTDSVVVYGLVLGGNQLGCTIVDWVVLEVACGMPIFLKSSYGRSEAMVV